MKLWIELICYRNLPWAGSHRQDRGGFSLIEILVSIVVLAMISVAIVSVTSSVQNIARRTSSRAEQFREARRAFERINQRVSQATLNSYWDYVDASSGKPRALGSNSTFTPGKYALLSELRYLQKSAKDLSAPHGGELIGQTIFFQAPLGKTGTTTYSGMNALINTVGYYIEKSSDASLRPAVVNAPERIRYRLFELTEPADKLTIYSLTSGSQGYTGTGWFTTPLAVASYSTRLADNIVALLFQAEYQDSSDTTGTTYSYSSAPIDFLNQSAVENTLPSNVRVTLVAVDEPSAKRIEESKIVIPDAQDSDGLDTLEKQLISNHLNYRKFESVIPIQTAKWSTK
jgi:uncharacterized protein (TIGR02599 family)